MYIFIILYCVVACDFLKNRDCVSFFPSPSSNQLPASFFMDAQWIVIILNWMYVPYSPTTRTVATTKLTIKNWNSKTSCNYYLLWPQNTTSSQFLAFVLRIISYSFHIWPPLLQPTYWCHGNRVQSWSKNRKRLVVPLKQVHVFRVWSREE